VSPDVTERAAEAGGGTGLEVLGLSLDWGYLADAGIRMLVAVILGGAIGLEREIHDKPAGVRTHALVCLGSALVMIISASFSDADPTRIAAQVVSGIGFLGAGTIIRRGDVTVGLTTAASLWAVAGVGLAAGHPDPHFMLLAAVAALLVLLTLTGFPRVESLFIQRTETRTLRVVAADSPDLLTVVTDAAQATGARVSHARLDRGTPPGFATLEIHLERLAPGQALGIVQQISEMPAVQSVRMDGSSRQT
jgi:putative Mg2+ transporter-C (MgtC) family protein